MVCANCCCQAIQATCSLKCPCCYDTLSSSAISSPSALLHSLLNDVLVKCIRKCGKTVKVQHYQHHLAGNCRSHYEDLNSPSKVTLRDVLDKPYTSPATTTEMKATSHLVRRLLCQEGSSSSKTSNIICDRLRENRAQRGVRNIEKRSIDFLKTYCFKPTEGNG